MTTTRDSPSCLVSGLRLLRVLTIGYSSSTDSALHQTGLNLHRRIILDAIAPRAFQTPGRWPWAVPPLPPSPRGVHLLLVSPNGRPLSGVYNHEAQDVSTEEACKQGCLAKSISAGPGKKCVGLTWLPRPTEPCVHYQQLPPNPAVAPLQGCHFWKVVHANQTGNAAHNGAGPKAPGTGTGTGDGSRNMGAKTVAPAGPAPIYPLVAAIANPNNKGWCPANQAGNLDLLDAIRRVPGEEEIWVDVGWSSGGNCTAVCLVSSCTAAVGTNRLSVQSGSVQQQIRFVCPPYLHVCVLRLV